MKEWLTLRLRTVPIVLQPKEERNVWGQQESLSLRQKVLEEWRNCNMAFLSVICTHLFLKPRTHQSACCYSVCRRLADPNTSCLIPNVQRKLRVLEIPCFFLEAGRKTLCWWVRSLGRELGESRFESFFCSFHSKCTFQLLQTTGKSFIEIAVLSTVRERKQKSCLQSVVGTVLIFLPLNCS
jgi:hypothetical protein